ncbi:MAG: hypothetical protein WC159_11115 [Sphaerochaetaceae bacterium]
MKNEKIPMEKWKDLGDKIKTIKKIVISSVYNEAAWKYPHIKEFEKMDNAVMKLASKLEDAMVIEHKEKSNEELLHIFYGGC